VTLQTHGISSSLIHSFIPNPLRHRIDHHISNSRSFDIVWFGFVCVICNHQQHHQQQQHDSNSRLNLLPNELDLMILKLDYVISRLKQLKVSLPSLID